MILLRYVAQSVYDILGSSDFCILQLTKKIKSGHGNGGLFLWSLVPLRWRQGPLVAPALPCRALPCSCFLIYTSRSRLSVAIHDPAYISKEVVGWAGGEEGQEHWLSRRFAMRQIGVNLEH